MTVELTINLKKLCIKTEEKLWASAGEKLLRGRFFYSSCKLTVFCCCCSTNYALIKMFEWSSLNRFKYLKVINHRIFWLEFVKFFWSSVQGFERSNVKNLSSFWFFFSSNHLNLIKNVWKLTKSSKLVVRLTKFVIKLQTWSNSHKSYWISSNQIEFWTNSWNLNSSS